MEERVMDQRRRMLNPDNGVFKIGRYRAVGQIHRDVDITPEHDKRGVIGLGEAA